MSLDIADGRPRVFGFALETALPEAQAAKLSFRDDYCDILRRAHDKRSQEILHYIEAKLDEAGLRHEHDPGNDVALSVRRRFPRFLYASAVAAFFLWLGRRDDASPLHKPEEMLKLKASGMVRDVVDYALRRSSAEAHAEDARAGAVGADDAAERREACEQLAESLLVDDDLELVPRERRAGEGDRLRGLIAGRLLRKRGDR